MLYYLIENKNGFEAPLRAGTMMELEREKLQLEKESVLQYNRMKPQQIWESIAYYIVPKREWDVEHCPLIPVDYS